MRRLSSNAVYITISVAFDCQVYLAETESGVLARQDEKHEIRGGWRAAPVVHYATWPLAVHRAAKPEPRATSRLDSNPLSRMADMSCSSAC